MELLNSLLQEAAREKDQYVVHRALVDFCDDLIAGIMLGRLLVWDGKGDKEGGWIWKSDQEWQTELRAGRCAVRSARAHLEKMGVIETAKRAAYGKPTIHYRLKKKALAKKWTTWVGQQALSEIEQCEEPETEALSEIEQSDVRNRTAHYPKSDNDVSEIEQCITGSTAGETTGSTAGREGASAPPSLSVSESQKGSGGKAKRPTSQQPSPPTPGSAPPLPAEIVYLEVFREPLVGKPLAELLAVVGEITNLDRWREVLLAWSVAVDKAGKPYNPNNVKGLLDWYRQRERQARASPARDSPKATRQAPTDDQRAKYMAQIAKLNGEQHERDNRDDTRT